MKNSLWRDQPRAAYIGSGKYHPEAESLAYTLARSAASAGVLTVCGGLGGVMNAACRGAKDGNGLTIGILPGITANDANPYVDIPIATGLGHMRNALVVQNADIVFAFAGGAGTLSEIGFALKLEKPVIAVAAWRELTAVLLATSAHKALELGLERLGIAS
ncbi:TIGR00725 family protein [Desulfovibrio inopinatus]|uniref:TIGR00725 family protein n=1 Tax=Desulfovibrio inopinatus TaxID=102109 RepID=UPI0003FB722B|nr:TIGR00725 family protein [Desulfovibrio inopinatus]